MSKKIFPPTQRGHFNHLVFTSSKLMVSQGNITLVCQYLSRGQPFYKWSSLHPEELKPNFGCLLLIMSLSFVVLLDNNANYLFFFSDTPSFWFTLKTSYDHAFHFSRQFGMSPHNYECLLIVANLQNTKNQASPSRQMSGKGPLIGITLPLQGG
jgi:hypothetical protein